MLGPVPDAAARWADALAAWAVPPPILEAAPESPWRFPTEVFARATRHALDEPRGTPSHRRAAEALPPRGSVVDVGVGAGAASLPLAPPAELLVGIDESAEMLAAFAAAAAGRGVAARTVEGRWPDVAPAVDAADVVVCHHVFYNVAALAPFAAALTARARRRVVVEITDTHPQSTLNPLWKALHGVERPVSPTAADAVDVLAEMGLDVETEEFERDAHWDEDHRAEWIAFTRRRLCVGPERDAEIDALLGPAGGRPPQGLVTLWWAGTAGQAPIRT